MKVLPLSHAQRGLWFLHRRRPESPAYNLATAARVHGEVSDAEIRAYFQAMVDRHPALRTTFKLEGEEPVQVVSERAEVAFEEVDAEGWTEDELRAGIEEAAWRPFDLERGPVFRVALFRRGTERAIPALVIAMHHIVADFGSLALLSPREEDKSYPEFVAWQADLLAGPDEERLWSYWREQLAGLPELDLPADRVRPENAPRRGRARWSEVGPPTLAGLKTLARSRRSTLYVTLLAAFQALLHRLTGQEDFAVGSPASGRPRGFTRTFGYFTNPLVLRADLAGEPSFRELVDRTRQVIVQGLDHQHLPLSLLTERLRPGGDLFRAMFVLHQGPDGLVSLVLGEGGGRLTLVGGIELESLPLARRAAQFDVTLAAGERRGGLGLELVYDAVRFDATTAARWLEHLAHLLAGAVEQPDTPISELPLLSPWERRQVLSEVNDGSDADLPWGALHQGFERQVAATPDAVALVDDRLRLTYRELNARASALAAHLRRLGAGPETVVGVRMPRTAELVVSLLGVLKAGAAYLPLDPSYPEARTAFMAEDADARLILDALPEATVRRRSPEVQPGNLAYLIYTSGSTGRPKGVAIEHAAAVRLVAWAGQAFSAAELRGVLAATSVSFDLSVFEIFVPLSFGGTVVLAENALALADLPARDEVTLVNTVPSALAGLLDLGGLPASVRTVNLAGEPLRRSLADRILEAGVRLWDLYGPSEDTTYSTGAVVAAGDPSEPVIGRPVAGSRAYVLDRNLRPLPLGIPGELCLGGSGLARGYLGRPELTAEKFVPDPYGGLPGSRLYRTGDLVRRRWDGALDYLGRIDHQVKVRGFRIELGEVEAALLALAWVREAVVVAREGALAAYVSLAGETPDRPEEALRDALRDRLPAPFVPSDFVVLDALPRTPNGKVDRKALPAPGQTRASVSAAPAGPRGIVEETLAAIWADLLDLQGEAPIGRDDRFFDIGGHSLLAARVLARVRETLGADLPLDAFFEQPTLAGLARRIETVRREADEPPIPRVSRDLPLPLSYAQQRFWLHDRLEPGRATYNMPLSFRLQGVLDPEALAGALTEIVRRHEVLRTTYTGEEDGPVQRIGPPPSAFPLPRVDLAALPRERAAAEAHRLLGMEARRPFDLGRGPLVRALLLRRSAGDHQLFLGLHHIACDGWSLGILLSDLSALMAGVPVPEPPLQYADFAVWQRREPVAGKLLAAWHDRLAGAPVLDLPADRPEPASRDGRGAGLLRLLPADLVAALATAARTQGATLFMALFAGFDALLYRHTGQTDLVVGTVVAGRRRVEFERVVGCFVNTLALRVDLGIAGSARTFANLLTAVRSVALAAFRDQDLPFERLVEELQPEREAARQPFPRALVVLQNEPLAPPALPGIAVDVEPVHAGTSRSDLAVSFHDVPGGLLAAIELGLDVFDEATVARLWERFQVLLAAAAADPLLPLADLPLLTEEERRQLAAWGRGPGTDAQLPDAVRLFERRAALSPQATALIDEDGSFTFEELSRKADRLASRLRDLGVAPGRIVGLCAPRSAGMVVGLLAIWKAGGAYLPLDPALPDARLAFLIGDALGDEPVVVTSAALSGRLAGFRTVLIEDESGDAGTSGPLAGPADPAYVAGPAYVAEPAYVAGPAYVAEPAYVIYTSGTTGRPKGVVVEHGQLAALLASAQRAFGFAADDRMPCVAPFSFDIFLFELLAPLLAGGTSVLVGLRPSLDVDRLVARLGGMTRLHAVPALMRQIRDAAQETGPWPRMRSLFVGGDRVPSDLLDDLRPLFPNADVHVLYGPTEATVLATFHTARPGETGAPIGRPLDHVEIVVADAAGRPAPVGMPGEIWIGGAGVARGYLNQPELSREKFPERDGRRFFRSADLARWRPDGVLEFLGRLDDQVKVRGFRIEPGEIEAAITRQPGVGAAAVVAAEGRLVAFVVGETGDLQDALRSELPEYMVPRAWRFLPELPLTAHGKVDREALAALGAAVPDETPESEAPRGPLEETIAAVFADVLRRERVGRWESLFDLGGDSLLATRIASRLRAALGVDVPLAAVFDAPTVAGVAAAVAATSGGLALPPLERSAEAGDAPLSFSQQRLWFLDRLEPGAATYNLPVAVRLRGPLDVPSLENALMEIVRRHEALRTTFHEGDAGPVQRVEPAGAFALPVADEPDEAAAFRRMAAEAVLPFDLESGPVFRGLLLRTAPDDHLLVANLHHIVSDGWSMGVLVRELSALYRGTSPPELPVQYADWARWQRRWLAGEVLEAELGWWREALRGLPERLELPTDQPRRGQERRRGSRHPVRLDSGLTRDLAVLARREGATLFAVVLAGFQALLGRRAGQDDFAVGAPVAGRTQVEIEGLIGFFANTLALRADLHRDPTGRELLRRTQRTVLAAYEHQHMPFERLVEELAPARQLGRTPLFETMLAFQNAPMEPPDLPDVTAELVPAETGTAKLDLLLDLTEQDGELDGSLEYDADLFDAVTIERLVSQLEILLRRLTGAPGEPVADLLLFAGVERRQILAEPEPAAQAVAATVFEPPQGRVEEELAAIWAEVLEREPIGRQDNFFDRGGHSLLATQVVARVRRSFGVEVPLRVLFEEPTLAGLAGRIAAASGDGQEPLAGAAGDGPAPLSFAQQRLWFLAQLDPASPVYNLPAAVRLRGDLDDAALERSLAALAWRHESLRTRFPLLGGEPAQVVDEAPVSPLPRIDLRALGVRAEAEARRLAAWEAARPFDVQAGPLFRSLLLRLADQDHRLLVAMHHIVSDGWSLGVFIRDLTALYAGQRLHDLPVRYRDFAVWQRAPLSGEALERSLAFWRHELSGLPPGIDLPVDRPRPPLQTFRGAVRPFALDADITGRLRDLARSEGATLFMVLLAGFQALLARWSGQEDFAVGTPVAGRGRVELEDLIGFFVNTLVLRGDLSGDPHVRTLVRRARERFLAAQAHQDLPFEKLVEEMRPERNLARPPLFQVVLALQNAPRAPLALPGLDIAPEPVETGTAKFEIQLSLEEADGGLAGALDFNRGLYDAATMDRLLGHLTNLLSAAVADPDGRALELEVLSEDERRQVLGSPAERFPRERPVHELFAQQAAGRPDAVALVLGDERLTYGALDRRANALAHRLRRLGVGPEERVAIRLERSIGLIVGILGILKAGGAYVPLDPEHPAERQAFVHADAEPRVSLTERDLTDLEDASPAGDAGLREDHAAYVIYTSGSTGRPKGVVVPHANVTRLLTATDRWFHFGPDDVWTLFHTPAFDFSVWEIWGALAFGGRLVIVPHWVSRAPSAFYGLIADEGVTVLNQTPSAFRQLVQAEGDLPTPLGLALRQVVFGGEALDPALLAPWFARHGDETPRMINMYGITETTVHVTWRRMTAADLPHAPQSPIGDPIPDLTLHLLDARQLPAPIGVPGEICVGGDGLARGYLGRPDLTATRFIPDPFGGQPGARLYRSGDLARRLPNGDVEYLGRIDSQVKIRGFRIELGEIEAALAASPEVRDAVVLARGDNSENRRLIAWVVPRNGELKLDELRGFLRGRLPEYMVPAAFVVLDSLPLTANGKLDRRALPDPQARSAEAAVLPRTETEEIIAAAWREALGLETVGVEDSFFDLGGHSLLVVQVHRRLSSRFPDLNVVDLFLHPTISALAGYLAKEKVESVPLQEETRERAEDRAGRALRQRELRRRVRGR